VRQKLKVCPPLARWRILCGRVGRSTYRTGHGIHVSRDALSSVAVLQDTNELVSHGGHNLPGRSF